MKQVRLFLVEIMGLDAAPMSGDEFNAVSNERLAKVG